MKYYLIAGERSGDLHGANLIKELKELDQSAQFRFMGGDMMQEEGGHDNLAQHYSSISFMGFVEVLLHLRVVIKTMAKIKRDILENKPDAIILIDFAGFNMRIAKFCKENGIQVHYYISPKIWAWNTKRVEKVKKYVNHMYCILPFEKSFYQKYNYKIDFVGNPVFDAIRAFKLNENFIHENNLESKPIIAVLPGSRKGEIEKMLIYMLSLLPSFPEYQFVVAAVSNLPKEFYEHFENRANVKIVYNQTYDLLSLAELAMVTSGTATLETAIFNVPQVVCYKTSIISYWIGRMVIKVKHISLVNLIAEKQIVTELIQDQYNPKRLRHELNLLLDESTKTKVLKGYEEMQKNLFSELEASKNTAHLIYRYLTDDSTKN